MKCLLSSVLFTLCLGMLCMLLFTSGCSKHENGEVKVGAILPLTGDNAVYGKALQRGMEVAAEGVNREWSQTGKSLRIIYEDSQANPQVAVSAFRKLIGADGVPMVIGDMFSAPSLAIAPISHEKKIVLLSPTASAVGLTDAGPWFFRIYPSDTYDGTFLAGFAFERLKARRTAVLYLQVSSTTAVARVFEATFTSLGGKVVMSEGHAEGATDFRGTLSKLGGIGADIVFLPSYLNEMTIILRQAKELGVSTQFLSISTFNDPKIVELAGDAAENVIFSSPHYDSSGADELTKSFVASFRSKYGETPSIWAGYGYDVVRVAAKAITDSTDPAKSQAIRDALAQIKGFPGVTGTITFDANGDVTKELDVLVVKNGKFIAYQ